MSYGVMPLFTLAGSGGIHVLWSYAPVYFSWKWGHPCLMELCPCLLELEVGASMSYGVMPLFTLAGSGGINVLWSYASIIFRAVFGYMYVLSKQYLILGRGHHGCDHIVHVIRFTTTCTINVYHN